MLKEVYDAGCRDFGENKVQEILDKYDKLPQDIRWHMIGHLQTNKVKYIVDKVDMIQSLDSEGLALEIDKRAGKIGKMMPVLIEVNIGREESKSGIFPEALDALCVTLQNCAHICVKGLMTIAPICADKNEYNRYFGEMKTLKDRIFSTYFPDVQEPILSMGMSGSFAQALENDSDIIRIGEGIFGKRNVLPKNDNIA
jgi:pyridoxal phosphate enzyme (YggS family)